MAIFSDFAEYFLDLKGQYSPNLNQTELAQLLGTDQGYISKIQKGERLPSDKIIAKIKEVWGVDVTEKVNEAKKLRMKRIDDSIDCIKSSKKENEVHTKPRLPIKVVAGRISDYYSGILKEQCEQIPVIRQFQSYDFSCFVKGDSMQPEFKPGDEIACKRVERNIEWGRAYLLDTNDGAYLKRLYKVEGDESKIKCVSYNHEFGDFLVDKIDIQGIYKIVGLIRYDF